MDRKYIIERAENGFVLTSPTNEDGSRDIYVFEGEDDDAFVKLATQLSYIFVKDHNKFGSDNIKITWDGKGRKVE